MVCSYSFTLWDKFGDGWGSAKLFVMNAYDYYSVYYPDCYNNPVEAPIVCFDSAMNKTGDFVVAAVVGWDIDFDWEVRYVSALSYISSANFQYSELFCRSIGK